MKVMGVFKQHHMHAWQRTKTLMSMVEVLHSRVYSHNSVYTLLSKNLMEESFISFSRLNSFWSKLSHWLFDACHMFFSQFIIPTISSFLNMMLLHSKGWGGKCSYCLIVKVMDDQDPDTKWRVLYHSECCYFAITTCWLHIIPLITWLLSE